MELFPISALYTQTNNPNQFFGESLTYTHTCGHTVRRRGGLNGNFGLAGYHLGLLFRALIMTQKAFFGLLGDVVVTELVPWAFLLFALCILEMF